MKQLIIPIIIISSMLLSCSGSNDSSEAAGQAMAYGEEALQAMQQSADSVKAAAASNSAASSKTVSKGHIESVTDISVYCQLQEQIVKLNIKDGMKVSKGQTLIVLEEEKLLSQLVQARNQFEQANFMYEEILVGQGYKKNEFSKVPEYVNRMAKVKSGYNTNEESLRQAEINYAKRNVLAPVSGTVSDVAVHQYDLPQYSTPICHIFDAEHLKVVFNILESERSRISIGHTVQVTTVAYVNEHHSATVNLISPKVDSNGMIKIEAVISDHENLMPGMTAFVDL